MRIAIFGAGAIGCYLAGKLAAAGGEVVVIGRGPMAEAAAQGLTLTDYRGVRQEVAPVPFSEGAEAAADAGLALVCVKAHDSLRTARELRMSLPPAATVITFQNGIGNAEVLSQGLGRRVTAGMIGFNVAWQGGGHFHRGTQGKVHVAPAHRLNEALFARAGLPLTVHQDMGPVLWAKLMLNLNNAVNALSGLPLRDQLSDRNFRRCLALAQEELLSLCAEAGQRLAQLSPLAAARIPFVLRLPDPLFRLIGGGMLRIDPLARSSMADDLAAGRAPELDGINGEVARLAARLGRASPVNDRLAWLVREAALNPRQWGGRDLLAALTG